MSAPRRVIVTGSRDWPDEQTVWSALDAELEATTTGLVVMHGGCPTGADAHAARWARCWNEGIGFGFIDEVVFVADWAAHGRAAGPVRNEAMVAAGADVVLAFPLGASRGTRGCMAAAVRAGLRVCNFDPALASLVDVE